MIVKLFGEIMQHLQERLKQHKYDVQKVETSKALATDASELGYNFNFDGAAILTFQSHYRKKLIKEAIEIKRSKKTISTLKLMRLQN